MTIQTKPTPSFFEEVGQKFFSIADQAPVDLLTGDPFAAFAPGKPTPGLATFQRVVQGGNGMGFFKNILKIGTGIVRGLIGLPAKAATAVRAAPRVAAIGGAALAGGAVTGVALSGDAAAAAAGGFVVNPATGQVVGMGGGNGLFSTVTTVTTINRQTGQTVRQQVFQGRPFIMAKEVAHMRSVARKLNRAHGKVPTRRVKATVNSMISDAIKDSILHQAQKGAQAALA